MQHTQNYIKLIVRLTYKLGTIPVVYFEKDQTKDRLNRNSQLMSVSLIPEATAFNFFKNKYFILSIKWT